MAEQPLPNKCKHCGLRVRYSFGVPGSAQTSDAAFGEIRRLYDDGIVKLMYRREVGESPGSDKPGTTEFCAIASDAWGKNSKSCEHWVLKVDEAKIADYLAIHTQRLNTNVARVALYVSAVALVVSVLQVVIGLFR